MSGSLPLGFGDLLRVMDRLAPADDTARTSIAAMLGFERVPRSLQDGQEDTDHAVRIDVPEPQTTPRSVPSISPPPAPAPQRSSLESRLPPIDSPRTSLVIRVVEEPDPNPVPPAWLSSILPPPQQNGADDDFIPDFEPLFAPASTRSLIAAALAVPRAEGEVCIDQIIDRLARGLPITRLPREVRPTLRMGIEILVDHGDGMEPFSRDAAELVDRVRHIVGEGATRVLHFAVSPLRAGTGARRRWTDYRVLAAGTPVLVLSDLGIGGADPHLGDITLHWLDFLDRLHRACCPAIAFVPYPMTRWPVALAARMSIIEWDRSTTVACARRAAPAGRRRP
jgi:hypothetical protein